MQSASITVSTRADIKAQTKKIAKEKGVTVSGLINSLLQQVIGNSESPTPYLLQSINRALQQKKKERALQNSVIGKTHANG